MRILMVVQDLDKQHGGPSECVPRTAMALVASGCEVGIACYDAGEFSHMALEAFDNGVAKHVFHGDEGKFNPLAISLDMVRRFEDVAKSYDTLILNANWRFPIWWAAHVARKLAKPYVMMPHGSFSRERLKISALKKRIFGAFDRYAARRARSIWTTSTQEAKEVEEYLPGVKTSIFPIGLDIGDLQSEVKKPADGKVLLYMSRISPIKGLDILAEAWGRVGECRSGGVKSGGVDEWKLVITGPDDRGYTDEIKKVFAAKCAPGSYEFRGPVYGEEKLRLLSQVDAFILPTRCENWGIVVAEAMASGLPVICTKGAPWECLASAGAGWWTDISAEAIADAITEMAGKTDDELAAMGRRGREWVEANLDWKAIGKSMKAECETYVQSGKGAQ